MTDTAGLFPEPPRVRLKKGDTVEIQTIWGAESATVLNVRCEDGFPMVRLQTEHGDQISINVARVKAGERSEPQVTDG